MSWKGEGQRHSMAVRGIKMNNFGTRGTKRHPLLIELDKLRGPEEWTKRDPHWMDRDFTFTDGVSGEEIELGDEGTAYTFVKQLLWEEGFGDKEECAEEAAMILMDVVEGGCNF